MPSHKKCAMKNGKNDGGEVGLSSGNIFIDLGFPPKEAKILAMRSNLMCELERLIAERRWTQAEAAKVLGIGQSRVSDLVRGKWDKFSLDMLITLMTRAGRKVELVMRGSCPLTTIPAPSHSSGLPAAVGRSTRKGEGMGAAPAVKRHKTQCTHSPLGSS